MYIHTEEQARSQNQKRTLSQNILIVCDFNINFVYLLAGQEGLVHNKRVLIDTQAHYGFTIPEGKYQLGDIGYSNSEYIMVLYQGVQYYLREQHQSNKKPKNIKELFNLQHTSLCNIIERIFSIIKRKFKILSFKAEYSFDTQVDLVLSLCTLYNFIRQYQSLNNKINSFKLKEEEQVIVNQQQIRSTIGNKFINQKRDKIAKEIQIEYQ